MVHSVSITKNVSGLQPNLSTNLVVLCIIPLLRPQLKRIISINIFLQLPNSRHSHTDGIVGTFRSSSSKIWLWVSFILTPIYLRLAQFWDIPLQLSQYCTPLWFGALCRLLLTSNANFCSISSDNFTSPPSSLRGVYLCGSYILPRASRIHCKNSNRFLTRVVLKARRRRVTRVVRTNSGICGFLSIQSTYFFGIKSRRIANLPRIIR